MDWRCTWDIGGRTRYGKSSGALDAECYLLQEAAFQSPFTSSPNPVCLIPLDLELPCLHCETNDTHSYTLPHRYTVLIPRWAASMGIAMAIVSRNRHQTFTQKVR